MPKAVSGAGGFLKKLGDKARKAFDAHKGDETVFGGGGDLPPGIDGGVAKLVECKFDTYKKGEMSGEYYFYAAGIVISPASVKVDGNDIRIEGGRTSLMEAVCDTPRKSRKTVNEHFEWVLNELRKLGLDTSDIAVDDLEAACAALKQGDVYFKFRTWAGSEQKIEQKGGKYIVTEDGAVKGSYPTEAAAKAAYPFAGKKPMTFHQWGGLIPDYVPADGSEGAVEEEVTEDADVPVEEPAAEETTEAGDTDIATLASLADGGDGDAAAQVAAYAKEQGMTQKQIDAAESWTALAEALSGGEEEAEAETETEAEAEWEPQKGEVYLYKPMVKTPKGMVAGKKAIEVEVTAVASKAKTVDLRSLEDRKTLYKAVAWDKLEANE